MRRPSILAAALTASVAFVACVFPKQPPPGASGAEIYKLQLCANCHGHDGQGKTQGPPLRELGRFWERGRLAAFLVDPEAFEAKDERLAELARKHTGDMGGYGNLSLEERLRLADFVLSL